MSAQVPTAPGLPAALGAPGALPKRSVLRPHAPAHAPNAKLPLHDVANVKLASKTHPQPRAVPLGQRLNGSIAHPHKAPDHAAAPTRPAHPAARIRPAPSARPPAARAPAAHAPAPVLRSADDALLEAQAQALRLQVEADHARAPAPSGKQKHSHLSRPPQAARASSAVPNAQLEIARALEQATAARLVSGAHPHAGSDPSGLQPDENLGLELELELELDSELDPEDAEFQNDAESILSDEDDDGDSVPDDLEFLRSIDPEREVCLPEELELAATEKVLHMRMRYEWSTIRPRAAAQQEERVRLLAAHELSAHVAAHEEELAAAGVDPDEARDTTMVAEYTEEILAYLSRCEKRSLANPAYMDHQKEIEWGMRSTLVDWLLQVHARYHMLPETIWIAINILDRFLSLRVVALAKLQLLGVTALLIAAKYEEILPPSVDEFVFVTEGGCTRDEILKGERIILEALAFNVSGYTSPYPFLRRISKADDYDVHSRTLAKFLMELTLLDHRFLRARPRTVAAMSMFLARRMLGTTWDGACVYYSGQVEEQLVPAANLVLERLLDPALEQLFVYQKYTARRFLRAATYARDWARQNHRDVAAAHAAHAQAAQTVHPAH